MSGPSCRVRNLRRNSLSGFRLEKDALAAGGYYLNPDAEGWLNADGMKGLCVVCDNCGSVVADLGDDCVLVCPDCGEMTFRVFQTFRLSPIKHGFVAHWFGVSLKIVIDVPYDASVGMTGVRYTVDGSDPTLTSPLYTKPIPYRKSFAPIRAAVFYADARSQVIEWDYGRAEKNRKRIWRQSFCDDAPESPGRKPKESPGRKPKESPGRKPKESPGRKPKESPGRKPKESPDRKPKESPGRKPKESPYRKPKESPPSKPSEGDHEKKKENKDKGCCCCMVFVGVVIGIGWIAGGPLPRLGWFWIVLCVLAAIGMLQDDKS